MAVILAPYFVPLSVSYGDGVVYTTGTTIAVGVPVAPTVWVVE